LDEGTASTRRRDDASDESTQAATPRGAGQDSDPGSFGAFVPRGLIGGALMGLANLVPGISGGTMLLAAGVYPTFIDAIAEVTRLRFKLRPLVVLATIGGAAALAIGLLAGPTRALVIDQRPLMYSFFIGLTLGGLPLVWRLARPATSSVWMGAVVAFALMVVMALGSDGTGVGGAGSMPLLVLSGLAGASAMILPGISGGYLLLLLGQYEPILLAISELKEGLIGSAGFDLSRVIGSMEVVVPVGIGVLVGIVGVSNGVRWLFEHYEKPTLGALLGLLLGAVIGLYPFQEAVPPEYGFELHGRVVAEAELSAIPEEDWPFEAYRPSPAELAGAGTALAGGLLLTLAIARIGRGLED
jgi:putative membrane protein